MTDAHRFHSAATFRLNAHRIVADHLATKHTNTQQEHKPAHQRFITMVCATFYCHMDARTRNVFKCSAHTHLSIPPTHTHSHARARARRKIARQSRGITVIPRVARCFWCQTKTDEVINLCARERRRWRRPLWRQHHHHLAMCRPEHPAHQRL